MNRFQQILQRDVKQVFFNEAEFGEPHTIEGVEMHAMFDDTELIRSKGAIASEKHYDGIFKSECLLLVQADEFGAMPKPGRLINVDGREWRVYNATNESGVYAISLGAVRT